MAPCFSMETRWAPILCPSIPTPKDSHPQKCHCHPKPPTHHLHALSWKCHHYLLAPAPFMCVSHLYPMSPGWHLCPLAGEVAFPPPAMEVAPPSPPHGCCSPCPHHACVTSLSGGMSPGVRALEDWAWPSRVPRRQRCPARTTRTGAVQWSMSPSQLVTTTSTSPSAATPYLVQRDTGTGGGGRGPDCHLLVTGLHCGDATHGGSTAKLSPACAVPMAMALVLPWPH